MHIVFEEKEMSKYLEELRFLYENQLEKRMAMSQELMVSGLKFLNENIRKYLSFFSDMAKDLN